MTARTWLRHPARHIHPPICPTRLERFPSRRAAELAIYLFDPHTTSTPCTHGCGGWHHTTRTESRPQ